MVPGMEYSDPSNTIHILVWGCRGSSVALPTMELLQRVQKNGGVAVMAHPLRRWLGSILIPLGRPCSAASKSGTAKRMDGHEPHGLATLGHTGLRSFAGLDFRSAPVFRTSASQCTIAGELTADAMVDSFRAGNAESVAFGRSVQTLVGRRSMAALSAVERLRRSLARIMRNAKCRGASDAQFEKEEA